MFTKLLIKIEKQCNSFFYFLNVNDCLDFVEQKTMHTCCYENITRARAVVLTRPFVH